MKETINQVEKRLKESIRYRIESLNDYLNKDLTNFDTVGGFLHSIDCYGSRFKEFANCLQTLKQIQIADEVDRASAKEGE